MNRKSYVHQISEIGPRERVRLRASASASAVASERRCVGVDRRCRESEGKAKIEGYMSVSDEEAHHRGYDIAKLFKDAPIVVSEKATRDRLNHKIALDFAKKSNRDLHIYHSQDSVK